MLGMNSSSPDRPRAKRVWFAEDLLHIELEDGRTVSARYDKLPSLVYASEDQRNNWRLIGRGVGIHWPDLDEDLSTEGLLRDAVRVVSAKARAS